MAGYYETKTFLRDEWNELQKGVENQLRTTYEEYLKRIGLKNEAEAVAKRKEEDAAGKKFGAQDVPFGVTGTAKPEDRKITSEYAKELGTAQASNDAQAAKQIAALTGGRITGNEPVYQFGTPEFNKYMQDQADAGETPVPPDAYLDAQAFADRYIAYSRLGTTKPGASYDPNIEVPVVGMGTKWDALNREKFATVKPGTGSTAATAGVQQKIDELFRQEMGYAPGGTLRDFKAGVDVKGSLNTGAPTETFGPEATEYYNSLKGKAGAGVQLTQDEKNFTDAYLKGREGYLSGLQFQGKQLNAEQTAEKNFLEGLGYIADDSNTSALTFKTDAQIEAETKAAEDKEKRQSAYDLLLSEFKQYGLEALVTPLKSLIEEGISPSEFTIRLRETDPYKKRFAANAQRVAKGLRALSEAEYIGTEDQYQDVMRRYGLPESYYAKGDLGVQSGFEKFLSGDVSAVELEDRIQTAQNRVINSNPEVAKALKEFYPGISNGDILAYTLDPTNAIEEIKRKVTAAEIGGAAIQSGLQTGMSRAEELRNAGINKQTAQQGFGTIAGGLQRGSQLASIYGEDPYTQAIAETEVFGLADSEKARKQRQKITGLEKATFGGQTGASSGALARDRAGTF